MSSVVRQIALLAAVAVLDPSAVRATEGSPPSAPGPSFEALFAPGCTPPGGVPSGGRLRVRLDNDLFGNQDQGYTSGFMVEWTSAALPDFQADCLPPGLRRLNRWLDPLAPHGGPGVVSIYGGQALFTPRNGTRRTLIANDRPYAAVLLAGIGYAVRDGETLRHNDLMVGLVGPAALGEFSQSVVHLVLGIDRFEGWSNQLGNEPVIQFGHRRLQRWSLGRHSQAIGSLGGRVGNFATDLSAGLELRIGRRLPDDFGSTPARPGSPGSRFAGTAHAAAFNWIGFVSAEGRFVARDLTLDGSTFRASHRVDRSRWVADLGYGFAVSRGAWELTFGRYHRSREFRGQRERPVYGSVTVTRTF